MNTSGMRLCRPGGPVKFKPYSDVDVNADRRHLFDEFRDLTETRKILTRVELKSA
jgi:hypothetical protein